MALNATFKADFTSFYAAVNKAEAELVDLSKGAESVNRSLNRMVDQFSGRKLVQEAVLIEKAIQQIGGTSKLTQTELEAVGRKASEAVAKLKAMGQDVPPGLQKLAGEGAKATSVFSGMLGTVARLAPAFGIAFSVGAVVNFGRELLKSADELQKLSDKTGIGVEALQRFKAIGAESGNTVEQLTGAVTQMQNRLASGDASAVGALKKLNLSLSDLRQLSPEDQFIAIGEAIKGVQDPAEQVALAMDLFGRSGAEILPSIKAGMDDVAEGAIVMSEETVKALDSMGDAVSQFLTNVKNAAANAVVSVVKAGDEVRRLQAEAAGRQVLIDQGVDVNAIDEVQNLTLMLRNLEAARERLAQRQSPIELPDFKKEADDLLKAQGAIERLLNAKVESQQSARAAEKKASDEAATAAKKHADEIKKLEEETRKYNATVQQTIQLELEGHAELSKRMVITREEMARMRDGLTSGGFIPVTRSVEELNKVIDGSKIFGSGAASIWDPTVEGAKKAKTVLDQLKGAVGGLNDIFKAAFEGGGGLSGAIQSFATDIVQTFTSLIPVVGGFVSQFSGAIVSGFKSLFGGPNEEQLKARQSQADFIRELERTATAQQKLAIATVQGSRDYAILAIRGRDAMLAIGKSAAEADRVVKGLLDTENPRNFAAAMREVQDALDLQADAQQTLTDTLSRYKFSIEELGPALRNQELSQQAQQLFKDWQVLTQAGVDVAAVGREMSKGISDFINLAKKTGTEVDPALKPMLQTMIDMGLLVDEAGNKIESLDDIPFAKTMSEGFKDIVKAVKELTDVIRIGLGLALDDLAAKINDLPDIDIGSRVDVPRVGGGPEDWQGLSFARGTQGRYLDFGRGQLAMLHGRERIMREGESAGITVTVNVAGSVLSERDLVRAVSDQLSRDLLDRQRLRAA